MQRLSAIGGLFILLISLPGAALLGRPAAAAPAIHPEIWISPTEDLRQHGSDFQDFFSHPEQWHQAAATVSRLSVTVRYLLTTPPEVVVQELKVLHRLGIPLDVSVPALPVDKHVCGNGIEGTVWPGEPTSYSKKLKALGVDVYSFSLDLPLTSGYREKRAQSCHLSIRETAQRTARATADMLAVYPNAKFVDVEVPTGIPVSEWSKTLKEWVDDYRHDSGRNFDGFMMDAWWQSDWRSAALETVRVLRPLHIPVGIGINASGLDNAPAREWIQAAKANACAVRATRIPVDFVGISNWQNMGVHGLPESDPASLTGLVLWMAGDSGC